MALKGNKQSPEHVAKRVAAWKNSSAYSKSKERFTELNKSRTGIPLKEETRVKQSKAMMGKQNSLGTVRSPQFKQTLSQYWAEHKEEHPNYIDGRSEERGRGRLAEMGKLPYREWRKAVLHKDRFTCQGCGLVGGRLTADHIKPWALFPELRYEVGNGRTLCHPCHVKTDTYAGKVFRGKGGVQRYKEFLKNQ